MAAEFVALGAQGRNQGQDTAIVLQDSLGSEWKLRANSTTGDLEIYKAGTLMGSFTGTAGVFAGGVFSESATAGVGYSTGAGGAVTQITSAATGVTLSKPCGQITTVALTTAAAAEERFTVTNTLVDANDIVVVGTTYAGAGTPIVTATKNAAGAFDIVITNVHASAALDALMIINFAVIKSVAA